MSRVRTRKALRWNNAQRKRPNASLALALVRAAPAEPPPADIWEAVARSLGDCDTDARPAFNPPVAEVSADVHDYEPPFDPPDSEVEAFVCTDDNLEPPFDAPDADDDVFLGASAEAAPEFDGIDEGDVIIGATSPDEPPVEPAAEDPASTRLNRRRNDTMAPENALPVPANDAAPDAQRDDGTLRPLSLSTTPRVEDRAPDQPVPLIKVLASWDRPAIAEMLTYLATDRRMARANVTVERGGLDRAVVACAADDTPDLLILDTTLRAPDMLEGLDRLAPIIAKGAKVVVIGAVNDIGLLRDLAQRGVSEYLVPPMRRDDLVRAVCRLYAEADKSRVVAVIGARGGVGASTLAQNLAWSIAERQQIGATLVDLDLSFGTAAFNIANDAEGTVAEALLAPEALDDELFDRITTRPTARLQMLTAPATLERAFEFDPNAVEAVINRARRASPFVILDLPHRWTSWVKQTLISADDVIIVAAPDLPSLRNTKNMLDLLWRLRPEHAPANVALSMVGVPKRPEFLAKDIVSALGAEPIAAIRFDPSVFGMSEVGGRMIGEAAPDSKAAAAIDALATRLTGREPIERKPAPRAADLSPLVLTQEAPAATADYIEAARKAAQAELAAPAAHKAQSNARPGLIRRLVAAAAGLLAPFLLGAWYLQSQSAAASVTDAPAAAQNTPADDLAQAYAAALTSEDGVAALQRIADRGYAPAQYRLAKIYERGEGVSVDLAVARQWAERAAAAGNVRAMHDLGVYLAQGEGGAARDEAAAFRWFRQAAEFGVADSQFNLGILYQQGRGVGASAPEALFWFLVAQRNGDTGLGERIGEMEERLTPLEIEQAHARAAAFEARTPSPMANHEARS